MPDQAFQRLGKVYRRAGLLYASLYTVRWLFGRVLESMDRRLVAIEQRRRVVEPWTISSRRFTTMDNKQLWNHYDWSQRGEEWSRNDTWKEQIIGEFLIPNIPEGGTALEVGPGGGRWTEVLQRRVSRLYVADVAERAIELCRDRFADCSNIEYLLGDGSTIDVPDCSIDAIWSYDVFVHINPKDARSYFQEFRRILKPGGRAVIHHPGPPLPGGKERKGWRSDLTDDMVSDFLHENGLRLVSQTQELVNEGDELTIFERPKDRIDVVARVR
jgi:ubiquinone/menaquinone biosynthesis C-methylase UbiE